jgi:hypothetical protein
MEYGTVDIATIMAIAYNGSILPQIMLDNSTESGYNDCVVNDREPLETI